VAIRATPCQRSPPVRTVTLGSSRIFNSQAGALGYPPKDAITDGVLSSPSDGTYNNGTVLDRLDLRPTVVSRRNLAFPRRDNKRPLKTTYKNRWILLRIATNLYRRRCRRIRAKFGGRGILRLNQGVGSLPRPVGLAGQITCGYLAGSFDYRPSVDFAVPPEALKGRALDEFPSEGNCVHPERWFDELTMNGFPYCGLRTMVSENREALEHRAHTWDGSRLSVIVIDKLFQGSIRSLTIKSG